MKYALLALVGLLCVAGTAEARIFGRRARVNVVVGGHAQAVVTRPVVVQQQVVRRHVAAQPVVVQQVQAVHAAPVIVQPAQVVVPAYQFFAR